MPSPHRVPIGVLRASHEHLTGIVDGLDDAVLEGPSYCAEWNVGQVLSHLGSGAEIALMNLDAARSGSPAPERSDYEAVWAKWNARTPREMADAFGPADEAHISALESIPDDELDSLEVPAFGGRILDASGAALMRLGEHAVHTWDVEVTVDPAATMQPAAAALIVDTLPGRAGRLGRGDKPEGAVAIHTAAPERDFVLSFGEEAALEAGAGPAPSSLTLPAEALIRLLYGRLDAEHTPAGTAATGAVSLAALREAFPGF